MQWYKINILYGCSSHNSHRTYWPEFVMPAAARPSANALHVAVSPAVMTELTERARKRQGVMRTRLTRANTRDALHCSSIGGKKNNE